MGPTPSFNDQGELLMLEQNFSLEINHLVAANLRSFQSSPPSLRPCRSHHPQSQLNHHTPPTTLLPPYHTNSKMVHSALVLGFPRIGDKREVKKAVEAYWGDKISEAELLAVAKEVRISNWQRIKAAGVDFVPSNDFTLYDHVLDHCTMFNPYLPNITMPNSAPWTSALPWDEVVKEMVSISQLEQVPRHQLPLHRPEVSKTTQFKLCHQKPVDEYLEAKAAGIETRPAIFGPLSFLLMGKT
ncbi:hypothetical protein KEM48_010877, partial [Puccinia striiformis f. sp. tritici PST-130]